MKYPVVAKPQLQIQLQFELRLALLTNFPTTQPLIRKSSLTTTLFTALTPIFDYNFNYNTSSLTWTWHSSAPTCFDTLSNLVLGFKIN